MKNMRHYIIAAAISCVLSLTASAQVKIDKCGIKSRTSFAVITDSATYEKCGDEIRAYKQVLEEEGLGTWIVSSSWSSPDEVKAEILKLAAGKPALEGIVLVGDVPIVMVRQGQHLTTAFKMNEEVFPIFESSVASDRFYDDFGLKFDFIKRDSLNTNLFYYRLTEEGDQHLRPDIYSARMKVPPVMKGDKYEIMRKYLRKVVKAHREYNPLDVLTYFAGHGYNSDCLTIWRQKPLVFREYFPYAFSKASHNRFLNFREDEQMKWNLLSEVARPEVDLFVFSEHGAFDTQYINGTPTPKTIGEDADRLKRSLASSYRYYGRGSNREAFLHEVDSLFHIGEEAFADSVLAVYDKLDSIETRGINIYLDDIMKGRSSARMIVFNACYNGSFHNPGGYVAGCHVFGDGGSIVAQGNTINVLQDKWEDKLMGYLSIGERVGMWQKEVPYLESHLIGDPTWRFTAHTKTEAKMRDRLHEDLVFNAGNAAVWEKYTASSEPLLRCAGITHLSYIDAKAAHKRAAQMLDDPSMTVRIHAFNALCADPESDCADYVRRALEDSYELMARTGVKMASVLGDTTLVKDVESFSEAHPEMLRASDYAATDAVNVLNGIQYYKQCIKSAGDKSLAANKRVNAIRTFRNSRYVPAIRPLLSVVADSTDDSYVRTVACEALGWYTQSNFRGEIISSLESALDKAGSERVASEIRKTIKRLKWQ